MILMAALSGFLLLAFLFALLACTARTTERLLWGAVICSLGLGLAAQVAGGGYYGLMMLAVFLATDLVIYLYFRTQSLLPERLPKNRRADRVYRIFFLWLALCAVAGSVLLAIGPEMNLPSSLADGPGLSLLHGRIWGGDWLLILVPLLSIVGLVVGSFFLVRKERT